MARARSARGGRPTSGRPGPGRGESGALSLELALTVPTLFLLVLLVFHAAVVARDALLVQDAAQRGARVAATTTDHAAVVAAVRDAMDGRGATVTVAPRARGPGDVVRVTVSYRSRAGPAAVSLTGRAAAAVEPGVGR